MQIFEKKVTSWSPWVTRKIVMSPQASRLQLKHYVLVVVCFLPIILFNWFLYCQPEPQPAVQKERIIIGEPGKVL